MVVEQSDDESAGNNAEEAEGDSDSVCTYFDIVFPRSTNAFSSFFTELNPASDSSFEKLLSHWGGKSREKPPNHYRITKPKAKSDLCTQTDVPSAGVNNIAQKPRSKTGTKPFTVISAKKKASTESPNDAAQKPKTTVLTDDDKQKTRFHNNIRNSLNVRQWEKKKKK